MYLALLLALIAGGIGWGEPFSLLIVVTFIFFMNHFQIRPEEKVMEEKFGSDYLFYKENVRRWI
jgi:protein-S-isoprenylcysteine O-methyltransferase Ste14